MLIAVMFAVATIVQSVLRYILALLMMTVIAVSVKRFE